MAEKGAEETEHTKKELVQVEQELVQVKQELQNAETARNKYFLQSKQLKRLSLMTYDVQKGMKEHGVFKFSIKEMGMENLKLDEDHISSLVGHQDTGTYIAACQVHIL